MTNEEILQEMNDYEWRTIFTQSRSIRSQHYRRLFRSIYAEDLITGSQRKEHVQYAMEIICRVTPERKILPYETIGELD